MKFKFKAWVHGDRESQEVVARFLNDVANGEEITAACGQISASAPDSILLHIVDVTPSAHEDNLAKSLHKALLNEWKPDKSKVLERFIFMGAKPSVDTWEDEYSAGDPDHAPQYSRKKAVEFYIRAFQRAGLAHYGSIVRDDAPVTGLLHSAHLCPRLAQSALVSLTRFYAEPPPGGWRSLETARQRLHASTLDLLKFLEAQERYLEPGDKSALIREIAELFQLGKRNPHLTPASQDGGDAGKGAYALRASIYSELSQARADAGSKAGNERAARIAELSRRLARYELLRDMGRCIGSDAVHFLRTYKAEKDKGRGGGLLIIDDGLCASLESEKPDPIFLERLRALLQHMGWGDKAHVTNTECIRNLPTHGADGIQAEATPVKARNLLSGRKTPALPLQAFDLILMEVDSKQHYIGPLAVQRLAAHLRSVTHAEAAREEEEAASADDETWGAEGKTAGAGAKTHRQPGLRFPPPIIVLTRTESVGHVQQSLNLGAVAYVLKERIYQLPFQMRRALEAVQKARYSTRKTSAFKLLEALRPEIRAKLHKINGTSFVHGGIVTKGGILFDSREEKWIRELPKADLHCHLGTCIPLPAIRAMAMNTVGYTLAAPKTAQESDRVLPVMRRIAASVVLAEYLHASAGTGAPHPLLCLAVAAAAVSGVEVKELPAFGLGDAIVKWLAPPSDGIREFEAVALLVSMFGTADEAELKDQARYQGHLTRLSVLLAGLKGDDRTRTSGKPSRSSPHPALAAAATIAEARLRRIVKNWEGPDTIRAVSASIAPRPEADLWRRLAKTFRRRCRRGARAIGDELRMARRWLAGDSGAGEPYGDLDRHLIADRLKKHLSALHLADALTKQQLDPSAWRDLEKRISLRAYVELPEHSDGAVEGNRRGLQRYLWGADYLGASHLQYPENLLIAAYAITRDNAEDNVTYSEVRCETPGYAKAGMSAADATQLLCAGFDLAATYLATERKKPLVRVNVLLAAKRHKSKAAAREVVALMEQFVHRRGDDNERVQAHLPRWWQPSSVVGFDISGDESKTPEWLPEILSPLAVKSASITIHAGEAATADSIWTAVYLHNATRIGHGLRLRENSTLLNYCVREGICMEMCPNSNVFTNGFFPVNGGFADRHTNPRRAYPLQEYMEAGLEVAVATDNRYIHRVNHTSLTSEYMTAARLSNGLTRWEILQLTKAGFKNAFLDKGDIQRLVTEMERRTYKIISRGWF